MDILWKSYLEIKNIAPSFSLLTFYINFSQKSSWWEKIAPPRPRQSFPPWSLSKDACHSSVLSRSLVPSSFYAPKKWRADGKTDARECIFSFLWEYEKSSQQVLGAYVSENFVSCLLVMVLTNYLGCGLRFLNSSVILCLGQLTERKQLFHMYTHANTHTYIHAHTHTHIHKM